MTQFKQLDKWIGNPVTVSEVIPPFPSNALAATLDRDDPLYGYGSIPPPLWHWMHFLPVFKLADAGNDGHAALGTFLPPVPLPRRMWAGSRLKFLSPMHIGSRLRKNSNVANVEHKKGRSGDLVFVTVSHTIFDGDTLCLEEEHDIVYREAAAPGALTPKPLEAPGSSGFSRQIAPSPLLLFRYSALTFNGHRIHYDQPYCVNIEGYEGLVVHGPLLATLLLDLLRRNFPDAEVANFEFRAMASVSDNEPFTVHGQSESDNKNFKLWVRRHDGALAMDARATIR